MAQEVRIAADDKCLGVDAPDGRTYKFDPDSHAATVPADVAEGIRKSGMPHIGIARPVGLGWSPRYENAWDRIFGDKPEESEGPKEPKEEKS